MGAFDIIVVVLVSVAVVAVIGWLIYRKVRHKGCGCCDCGCNCTACSQNKSCNEEKK